MDCAASPLPYLSFPGAHDDPSLPSFHCKSWLFSCPGIQLKDTQYPHDLIDDRNKFVNIFEKLCQYKEDAIEGMQNRNFESVYINEKAFDIDVGGLFNYYDSLTKDISV